MEERPQASAPNAHRDWYVTWSKLLAGNFLFQIFVQGLGFFTGLLIVRSLSKEDYAYFTIISSVGPIIAMIADSGITSGLLSIGGQIWQDNDKMGSLVRTGLHLRLRFALVSILLVVPILAWMLFLNHASIGLVLCLVVLTLVGIFPQLSLGVTSLVVQLRQQLPEMRDVALKGTLLRLALIVLMIVLSCSSVTWAVFAGAAALILQAQLMMSVVRRQITWDAPRNDQYQSQILSIVRKVAPLTVYFCIQSQLSVWLISVFGTAHRVADLGALGRFGMVYGVFISVAGMVMVPRFARIQDHRLLKKRYFQVTLSYLALVLALVAVSALFPGPFLFLLGFNYSQLGDVLWLVFLSSGLVSVGILMGNLNNSRGWIPPAIVSIPLEMATLVILVCLLDLSQVRGVLLLTCFSMVPVIFFTGGVSLYQIRKLGRQLAAQ